MTLKSSAKKRICSLLLTGVMLVSMVSTSVFAEEIESEPVVVTETEVAENGVEATEPSTMPLTESVSSETITETQASETLSMEAASPMNVQENDAVAADETKDAEEEEIVSDDLPETESQSEQVVGDVTDETLSEVTTVKAAAETPNVVAENQSGLTISGGTVHSYSVQPGVVKTLSVDAQVNSGYTISYQWKIGAGTGRGDLTGFTGKSYTTERLQRNTVYVCTVSDGCGYSIDVIYKFSVNTLTLDRTSTDTEFKVLPREDAVMTIPTAHSSLGDENLTYTWCQGSYWSNSKILAGVTGSSYTIKNVTGPASYVCQVTDGNETLTHSFTFNVDSGLKVDGEAYRWITVQPGESKELSVIASINAGNTITYQWKVDVPGGGWVELTGDDATTDTYYATEIQKSTQYICVISDQYGNSERVRFHITVDTITIDYDKMQTRYEVYYGDTVTCTVVASSLLGNDKLTYQWSFFGEYKTTTDAPSCTIEFNERIGSRCSCAVSDGNITKSVAFDFAVDTVNVNPNMKTKYAVAYGESATLLMDAESVEGLDWLSYQWYQVIRSADSSDPVLEAISGARQSTFTVKNVTGCSEYACKVTGYWKYRDTISHSETVYYSVDVDKTLKPNPATCKHSYGAWKVTKTATALANGTQTRICSICGNKETKNIAKLPAKMILSATSVNLKLKQSTTALKVTGMATGDYLKTVKVRDTSYATVSNINKNGTFKLTAKNKVGSTTLTVTLASGNTGTVTVKVQKAKVTTSSIKGVAKTITLVKGKTATLKPSLVPITSQDKITYKSSNKKIATVSSKGVIKGVKAGKAKITVKAGKKSFTCTVTVTGAKTTKISGVKATATIKKGKTLKLNAKVVPSNSDEKLIYTSSNKKVATVSSKGVVKGVKKGTAVITVKSGSKKVTCKVTVK